MLAMRKNEQVKGWPGTGKGRDLLKRKINLQVQVTGLIEKHLSLTWPLCDQASSSLCSIITQVN